MQALKDLGVKAFLDDAEWRKRKDDIDANGLQPGEELRTALFSALRSSRAILLVHSPAYFASSWCRWELNVAEELVKNPKSRGRSKLMIYLILARYNGRLDLSEEGQRLLFVDLTNVRERAAKLAFALQRVNPRAEVLRCSLGRRSLQDLLAESETQGQVNTLRQRHKMFRDAHAKMQAFKECHDAIQCAQDAWRTLAVARDGITTDGQHVVIIQMASDLSEKCDDIQKKINNPVLAGEVFPWRSLLDRAVAAAASFRHKEKNLEALNQTLERTRTFLFLSIAALDLNNRISAASKQLPIDSLTKAVEPLKRLREYCWQPEPLAQLTELSCAFDELASFLAQINDLVTVHDVLQNIDSIFSTALNVEAKLVDIENIWPDIEQARNNLDPRLVASYPSLQLLGTAADTMSEYLQKTPESGKSPSDQVENFRYRLNQSFVRVDTDLRTETFQLEKKHEDIDELLGRLAGRG